MLHTVLGSGALELTVAFAAHVGRAEVAAHAILIVINNFTFHAFAAPFAAAACVRYEMSDSAAKLQTTDTCQHIKTVETRVLWSHTISTALLNLVSILL